MSISLDTKSSISIILRYFLVAILELSILFDMNSEKICGVIFQRDPENVLCDLNSEKCA